MNKPLELGLNFYLKDNQYFRYLLNHSTPLPPGVGGGEREVGITASLEGGGGGKAGGSNPRCEGREGRTEAWEPAVPPAWACWELMRRWERVPVSLWSQPGGRERCQPGAKGSAQTAPLLTCRWG